MTAKTITFITPTYQRDYERFLLQRESIERCSIDLPHIAIINHENLDLFKQLPFQKNLILLSTRDVLPKHLEARRLAQRHSWKHPAYWFGPKPLHGWMIQQLLKLGAAAFAETEGMVCLDSDTFFVSQVTADDFFAENGKVKLYETDDDCDVEMMGWLADSMKFLGISPTHQAIRRYWHSPVPFHRQTVLEMQSFIGGCHKMHWMDAMVKAWVTEYGTYGVYARHIDKLEHHEPAPPSMTLYYWWQEQAENLLDDFVTRVHETNAKMVLVNSNLGLSVELYRPLVEQVWALGL